jgi:hypothetical protein
MNTFPLDTGSPFVHASSPLLWITSALCLSLSQARIDGMAAGEEALRNEDEEDTQAALIIMRRAGVIAGVNGPRPEPEAEQRETNRHVVLRTRPAAEVNK